jgi:hypothetical protein
MNPPVPPIDAAPCEPSPSAPPVHTRSRLVARRLDVLSRAASFSIASGLIGLGLLWSQPSLSERPSDRLASEIELLTSPMPRRPHIEIVPVRTQQGLLAAAPAPPTSSSATVAPSSPAQQPTTTPPSTLPSPATIAAREECKALLGTLEIEFEDATPIDSGPCQAPAPVKVTRLGKARIDLSPPAVMNCRMAATLADWVDKVLQPAAREHFAQTVSTLSGVQSFACRNRNNAAVGPISEHAFANAFDLAEVRLSGGRRLAVVTEWGPVARDEGRPPVVSASAKPAPTLAKSRLPIPFDDEAAEFLRRIHAGACPLFTTVLGPEANDAHRDHLHFDLKSRTGKTICE